MTLSSFAAQAIRVVGVAVLLAVLAACNKPALDIAIVAGSENQPLEDLVQEFCKTKNAKCSFSYKGSIDIGFGLKSGGTPLAADVVWPAASIWIDLFDERRKVKHLASVAQTPVVLGVRKSKAEALGWTRREVTTADVLATVAKGELKFLMSSATQSNSGAGAYLAMLATALGKGDVLTEPDLADDGVRGKVRTLLAGMERTSGSSGWLGDLFLEQDQKGVRYMAMWNYEAVLKETNEALASRGSEPLWLVYPADGVSVSDSPLGYHDRGRGPEVEAFVLELQKHLASQPIQKRIAATGRRMGIAGGESATAVPDWNFDPARAITAVRPPEPKVLWAALNLYQEALRKPSLSALCLDVSGSMAGDGIRQLHAATDFLFTPAQTREMLVQWSPDDKIIAIPFSSTPGAFETGKGVGSDQSRLRQWGQKLAAFGGTDMYACAEAAMRAIAADSQTGTHLPAIVIMTDGRSEGSVANFLTEWRKNPQRVPVFGITFGAADRSQLDYLAQETGGRVFDGRTGLVDAFRAVRGYN